MRDQPPAELNVGHAERIACRLRDFLDDRLDAIASNDGEISGLNWHRRPVAEMSDAEITVYLSGVRSVATGFADWLENYFTFDRTSSGTCDLYPITKHGATCEVIDEDIAGAEGECFHRRHPEKHPFPGRLRKLNAMIAQIRGKRVQLAAEYHAGLLSREKWSLKAAGDFAYDLLIGPEMSTLRRWVQKSKFCDLDDVERDAVNRVGAEHTALRRACDRVRNAYSEQLRHESDVAFRGTFANGRAA